MKQFGFLISPSNSMSRFTLLPSKKKSQLRAKYRQLSNSFLIEK